MKPIQSVESIHLSAKPEIVFPVLRCWDMRSRWRPGVKLSWDGNSQAWVGQKVKFQKSPWARWTLEVTGVDESGILYFRYIQGPLRGRGAFQVEPEEGGSKVSFIWMKVEPFGWLSKACFALGRGLSSHQKDSRKTLEMLGNYIDQKGALAPGH